MSTSNNNNKNTSTSTVGMSRQALDAVAPRAVRFLRTLSTSQAIRQILASAGYTMQAHTDGWNLFFAVCGYGADSTPVADNSAALAMSEIAAWEQPGFVRAQAALRHKHPAQGQFVFNDLSAAGGPMAIGSLATFLDRLDALESSPDRKATRKGDHAALATLSERGIDENLRKHLRKLVEVASIGADAAPVAIPDDVAKRRAALDALYMWLQDWSDTARVVVTRRVDLISLGIAKRRSRKAKAQPVVAPPVVTPAPPPVAPAPAPAPPALPPFVTAPGAPVPTAPAAQPVLSIQKEEKAPDSRAA